MPFYHHQYHAHHSSSSPIARIHRRQVHATTHCCLHTTGAAQQLFITHIAVCRPIELSSLRHIESSFMPRHIVRNRLPSSIRLSLHRAQTRERVCYGSLMLDVWFGWVNCSPTDAHWSPLPPSPFAFTHNTTLISTPHCATSSRHYVHLLTPISSFTLHCIAHSHAHSGFVLFVALRARAPPCARNITMF